jgi:endonuclease V-like protein UPF0215 family
LCSFRKGRVDEKIVPRGLGGQPLQHCIDENPDLGREVTALRKHGVDRQLLRLVAMQQANQPAGLDVLADQVGIELDDAQALQG